MTIISIMVWPEGGGGSYLIQILYAWPIAFKFYSTIVCLRQNIICVCSILTRQEHQGVTRNSRLNEGRGMHVKLVAYLHDLLLTSRVGVGEARLSILFKTS